MPSRLAAALVCAPALLAACGKQPTPQVTPAATETVTLPAELRGYHLQSTEPVKPPGLGTISRYANGSRERVGVFVYPILESAKRGRDPRAWVRHEGSSWAETMPIGVERGWYDDFRLEFSDPDSVAVGQEWLPGHRSAFVTRRNGVVELQMQFLFIARGRFVKVRASVPEEGWMESEVKRFAHDLVVLVARR